MGTYLTFANNKRFDGFSNLSLTLLTIKTTKLVSKVGHRSYLNKSFNSKPRFVFSRKILNRGNFTFPTELPPIYKKPPRKNSQIPPLNFQILSLRTLLVVNCLNYPSLQNYAVLGLPKTTSFCPKRRSFGYFRF
jgi:hypothetical protein